MQAPSIPDNVDSMRDERGNVTKLIMITSSESIGILEQNRDTMADESDNLEVNLINLSCSRYRADTDANQSTYQPVQLHQDRRHVV